MLVIGLNFKEKEQIVQASTQKKHGEKAERKSTRGQANFILANELISSLKLVNQEIHM